MSGPGLVPGLLQVRLQLKFNSLELDSVVGQLVIMSDFLKKVFFSEKDVWNGRCILGTPLRDLLPGCIQILTFM